MSRNDILNFIENNLKENITPEKLSQRYHCSTRQLYYALYDITGMSVMAYVRKRKISCAAREIALGRKMYDVAMDYGFETQAGFYKAFFQCIGCTPSEYRRHHQLRQHKKIHTKLRLAREVLKNMEKIEIRKMRLTDTKSLWENIFSANTPEEVSRRVKANVEKMENGECIVLVAVAEEHVVGTALIEKSRDVLSSHRAHLVDVVVNPAFQRQGLGKRLCQECFSYAKQLGCDHVITSCRSNGTELFDKAIGMEQYGRIPDGIREPWGEEKIYDEIFFYKRL